MKDSELNGKRLKINYNRILVICKTSNVIDCILISIAKKLKGFAVYIKYGEINFNKLQVMYTEKFENDTLEDANSFSIRAESYYLSKGISRLEDSYASKIRVMSRIGDELSRPWKRNYCIEARHFFTEYEVDKLKQISYELFMEREDLSAAEIIAPSCEGYHEIDHKEFVFNCYVDMAISNDYMWDAICVDNSGYEDEFDLNVSYVVDGSLKSEFLKVFDKFGVVQELSNARFKVSIVVEE